MSFFKREKTSIIISRDSRESENKVHFSIDFLVLSYKIIV